jgi:hypothetical protein
MLVYEDNFGFLNISEPEERAFFDFVRRQSVLTACERCERPVRLIPPKAVCACCISALECGAPALMQEYAARKPVLITLTRANTADRPSPRLRLIAEAPWR